MKLAFFAVALTAFVLGGVGAVISVREAPLTQTTGEASVGGPFRLTAHNGREVTDADFRGKLMLVFFGYSYCPDICPTELQVMTDALNMLGDDAVKIQPLFITVDPQRDTPEQLATYMKNFHPSLLGLSGSPQAVDAAVKAYRAYSAKVQGGDADNYLMDHSAIVYLIGPDGRYITHFRYSVTSAAMAAGLRRHLSAVAANR
jgi:protein SCO1/2